MVQCKLHVLPCWCSKFSVIYIYIYIYTPASIIEAKIASPELLLSTDDVGNVDTYQKYLEFDLEDRAKVARSIRLWARNRNPPPWGFLKTYIFGNLIIRASQIRLSADQVIRWWVWQWWSFEVGYPSTVLCKNLCSQN